MDYGNYSTTSYGAQGGAGGGGFMPGSQSGDGSGNKRSYGKDTLRPVTIKQLHDAIHPDADADYFMIDNAEATQVTFVGQVRNISTQTTNITYRLDDGTGTIEVKVWVDAEEFGDEDGTRSRKAKPVEHGYARVWGRLKAFNNKRHVGANIIRPIDKDFNEIQYHMLEATAVHLFFTRGSIESVQEQVKAGGAQTGGAASGGAAGGLPAGLSAAARKVYYTIQNTPQGNEGLHVQQIAAAANLDVAEVMRASDELQSAGKIYTTVDEMTFALLDV